jgi:hypothetical protein
MPIVFLKRNVKSTNNQSEKVNKISKGYKNFGEFLVAKREEKDITLRRV